jgi:hypothetical protein
VTPRIAGHGHDCLPELFAFYQRPGFSENVGEIRLMRRVST